MKELEQAIQTAFLGMVERGELKAAIEENVQDSVKSVLAHCFRSYSPFQKALEEHMEKTVRIDFDALGLAGYNETLLKIIKAKLDGAIEAAATKHFGESLDRLLQNPPAEIKLSELITQFREQARDDSDHFEGVSWHVEHSDTSDGWGYVYLDAKPRVTKRECRYTIAFTDKGEIYNLALPYKGDVTKKMFAGPFYGFERSLFQMYAAKTRLVLDEADTDS